VHDPRVRRRAAPDESAQVDVAAVETAGAEDHRRSELPQVVEQLRAMADVLETMTPKG